MAEITSGIRHLLARPAVYDFFQHAVGAYAWRKRTIDRLVAPLLSPGKRLIDIGCGTAEILNYLPTETAYFGFDRNPDYISAARERFRDRNAAFECESVGKSTGAKYPKFDVALAAGLIHHLDDGDALAFLEDAKAVLQENGVLILLADPVYTANQSRLARYVVSKDRGQNVRDLTSYLTLYRQVFEYVDSSIDMHPLRIPYTGVAVRCSHKPLPPAKVSSS
jgi:SAM-dependent methyltransferase